MHILAQADISNLYTQTELILQLFSHQPYNFFPQVYPPISNAELLIVHFGKYLQASKERRHQTIRIFSRPIHALPNIFQRGLSYALGWVRSLCPWHSRLLLNDLKDLLLSKNTVCYVVETIGYEGRTCKERYDDFGEGRKRGCWERIDAMVWKDSSMSGEIKAKYSILEAWFR